MIDINNLIKGDRRTLAKAITLLESTKDSDRIEASELLDQALPHTGKSFRLGITGVPGVGKSSFIEAFGQFLIAKGHKVAVLAVDPSSPINGGSIMGDKTRMEKLSQEPNAFIRPSPTSGSLGGVSHKTREAALLCEAAGFDFILIETVGVGQSEYEVHSMVDFFAILMLPNAGDELQGIKRGILELADLIIVNKADGNMKQMAKAAVQQYSGALELLTSVSLWKPKVVTSSSVEKIGISEIYDILTEYKNTSNIVDQIKEKRSDQNKDWFNKLIHELIELKINSKLEFKKQKADLEKDVATSKTSPLKAAHKLVDTILFKEK
ncbi:methylmalonyl Co-A mutase-associated GTPase MeaB [Bacteriovorax sp. PP10]|uniref:Methylmalonyl Co-A mutase-associated GTPase MeaB n=1 Tax=Bacteriovorax antarcticus TaxID=3088717 RepID=A0ABU5VSH7_9BACT|nr:methylmalonyl Co-A mutase-associated GTPase MeaB [Bacteriovorax sp. PP10]MEA9354965.1 methylmalonyl Co-A mutase-associated GTPase MeaB [Bacteriovorax sp. PP10]